MGLITLGWIFGSVWNTAVTGSPLTIFMKELGGTPLQFGLLAAMPFVASLLSVPASLVVESTGRRKKVFLYTLYLQRLLWFPIALLPLWLVSHYGGAAGPGAIRLFLLLMFIMHASGAAGGPAWVSWMADVVPERLRGKYFSRRRQWGVVSAVPAALLVGWLLDHGACDAMTTLRWCAIVFMCAAVFGVADIHLFQYLPESPKAPRRGGGLAKALAEPLRNRPFLWFAAMVATLTFASGFMQQFTTLYLLDPGRVGLGNATTQLVVLVVPMAAQFLMLPAWGRAVDRMGKKPVLALAGMGLVPVALGWCFVGPGTVWLAFVLAAAHVVLWSGVDIANFDMVLDMSDTSGPGGKRGGGCAYFAVNSVIVNVAGCLGGLAAGALGEGLKGWHWTPVAVGRAFGSYDVLFVASAVLRLAAVALILPRVVEPGARRAREALRFIVSGLGGSVAVGVARMLRGVEVRFLGTARAGGRISSTG